MQQINSTYQTVQTNNQQFTNKLNELIDYNKNKNTVEYRPNPSNSPLVEFRNTETFFDWLKEDINLRNQTIQNCMNYIESLLNHKEKVQAEMIQQNKLLEESKIKLKEIGEKARENAKKYADEELKKLEEERQRKYKQIEQEYDAKMKKVSDEYEERIKDIDNEIMEADEKTKMNKLKEFVFYHERSKLEEWCGKKCSEIIFDSDKDDWNQNTSVFDSKIINKSNLMFVIEDTINNKFGGYINSTIDKVDSWITDSNAFVFSLKSNGRINGMMKFNIKSGSSSHAFYMYPKSSSDMFGIGCWGIDIYKKGNSNTFCKQDSFDYNGIQHVLCGSGTSATNFTPKRFVVIQMK